MTAVADHPAPLLAPDQSTDGSRAKSGERIGLAAQHIWNGSAQRVLAHATSGPALQQNLVAVMEGKN